MYGDESMDERRVPEEAEDEVRAVGLATVVYGSRGAHCRHCSVLEVDTMDGTHRDRESAEDR